MNKRSIILIVCAVMASASITAQTVEKPLSAKELKAKKSAELKDFKAKQKAELAEFIAVQKNPELAKKGVDLTKPVLANSGDSIAYLFGSYQSNGLKGYLASQLKVDTTKYMNEFCKGLLDRVNIDPKDESSNAYQAGSQIGNQIENMATSLSKDYYAADTGKTIAPSIIAKAILASLMGKSEYKVEEAQTLFQKAMKTRQAANKEKLYGPNRAAGIKWLAENAKKEGVVVLPSGLQYKVITKGTGEIPTANQKVKVNYEGKLIDGTVFDSSYKRKQPTTFGVGQVIKGWKEALCKMPVGSKWEIYIPQELGYGDSDSGQIKPYSALSFTVELLSIEK